jgi:hypothetical protein
MAVWGGAGDVEGGICEPAGAAVCWIAAVADWGSSKADWAMSSRRDVAASSLGKRGVVVSDLGVGGAGEHRDDRVFLGPAKFRYTPLDQGCQVVHLIRRRHGGQGGGGEVEQRSVY